jgi:hypothetical protein
MKKFVLILILINSMNNNFNRLKLIQKIIQSLQNIPKLHNTFITNLITIEFLFEIIF